MKPDCSECLYAGPVRNYDDRDCLRHAPIAQQVDFCRDLRGWVPRWPIMHSGQWCGDFSPMQSDFRGLKTGEGPQGHAATSPDILSRQSPVEADRFQISSGPITPAEAINLAFDLETAIGEILNGTRKPGKMPVEPIAKLIQFVRDEALRTPVAASPSDTSQGVSEALREIVRLMDMAPQGALIESAAGDGSYVGYTRELRRALRNARAALRSEPTGEQS